MLGKSIGENGEPVGVRIVDASSRGMRLQSAMALNAGQAVKLEMGGSMFLGEVCYCVSDGAEGYFVGIVAEQCLSGLSDLRHLIEAVERDAPHAFERA